MQMTEIVSVAPVVFVITIDEPDAGTACTGFARAVVSFATHQ